jgi:cobalt-precorrin 5A hydrolase
MEAKGSFSSSGFVRAVTGVDNVCERAAILASNHGKLIMGKRARDGVTVAIAERAWRCSF